MDIANLEKQILGAAGSSRKAWETLVGWECSADFGPEGSQVFSTISEYYEKDPKAESADLTIIKSRLMRQLSNPKHQDLFKMYIGGIEDLDLSAINLVEEVGKLKQHRAGQELAAALSLGRANGEITPLIDKYLEYQVPESILGEQESGDDLRVWDIEEMLDEHFSEEKLIKLLPSTLNDRASGGVMPGDHIVLFACTEIGKTLFAVNLVYGFLRQGLRVAYAGNEEPVARVRMRLATRMSGIPLSEIKAQRPFEAVRGAFQEYGWDNFIAKDFSPGTIADYGRLVDKWGADVLIIDQLRNTESSKAENRVNQLEQNATDARNLGKSRGILVVSLTQAGDSADGKKILGRGDVDYSNVGIPGQADMLIGMGATPEMESVGTRCISFPKNKNGSHEPFFVRLVPELSKIEEM